MTEDAKVRDLLQAAIGTMVSRPVPLMKRFDLLAADEDIAPPDPDAVAKTVAALAPNDPAHIELAKRLRSWDHLDSADWTGDSGANTTERRHRINEELAVYGSLRDALDQAIPPYISAGPVVITAAEIEPWYSYEAASAGFYWTEYIRYLKATKGWTDVADLDRSTFGIVANLTDPSRQARYQAKGLVVGHVQSGKTANFTGVIARAGDAGYRLVIVLTGTTNILRHQTQRRIDKELLGRELVGEDYEHDPDWSTFASHRGLPSTLGFFDWLRLTGPRGDYVLLGYGGPVLDFKRADVSKPFHSPANLAVAPARIMIVKKHAGVLGKVARDLRPYQAVLADVPVLVIDDESDQASLDTSKPTAAETKKRTAVNRSILKLLEMLPRSQYVGYTATPFANVFVNPDDALDLFPKDFIVALDRPPGYMGAADFHDLDGRPTDGRPSNEEDFVRSARGPDDAPENLPRAIDSFVLSGGLKLYREHTLGPAGRFPHHTMLVHVSQTVDDHSAMRELILSVVGRAAYRSPSAVQRLRRLWEDDFRRVSASRGPAGGQPQTFEEIIPFIAECVDRVFTDGAGVLIVNGQKESDTPDFDRDSVWKILVGGNKLSRGYTIEGLTVSYYRRRADAADTLMQMGRWFGYRAGYEDLVRLFIGREEPKSNGEIIDLYMAFEAACRDELAFREEIRQYAGLPGEERIKPVQVPPLVQAHMLRPAAPNKMYNADLLATNLGGEDRQPTVAPSSSADAEFNIRALKEMLADSELIFRRLGFDGGSTTNAYVTTVSPSHVIEFLRAYRWLPDKRPVQRDLDFLTGGKFDPEIDDWVVIAPQLLRKDPDRVLPINGIDLTVKNRRRDSTGGRYAVYSEPDHVTMAKWIARHDVSIDPNGELADLARPHRAVMLLYPVQWYENETLITPGFALSYPPNSSPKRLVWGLREKAGTPAT